VLITLLVVVGVSLFQNFVISGSDKKKVEPNIIDSKMDSIAVTPPAPQKIISVTRQLPSLPVLQARDRLRKLPGFIPKEGLDQAYSKDNPGWENYRGLTNEYRIFRDKSGKIQAIQVIDRSGAGIQEVFFSSALQELAGVTTISAPSSEIKEGYEIRRGTVGGLQLLQYRDAQDGGRMRGFVITWP